ncbi:TPA: hypothetical protein PIH69_002963 [Staphylococcus aureus]|nr:hypothetical protein [Staphylococcus aureus]
MSIAARHHRTAAKLTDAQIQAALLQRLTRILITLATLALAVGGAWVGIVFREYIDRIIITAVALVVVPYAIYHVVRFFRDTDDE